MRKALMYKLACTILSEKYHGMNVYQMLVSLLHNV
jgi:hypothetical protein